MIDVLGYIALGLALFAMLKKQLSTIRWMHMISCVFYLIYGLLTESNPVSIGAILFIIIHIYHLSKLRNSKIKPT
jgi:hypothetical protein